MKKVILLFVIILLATLVKAQWQQTNGPTGGVITCFASIGNNTFAGSTAGVFLSTNNGLNWVAVNNGLTSHSITAMTVSGNNIYAATYNNGVFLSTNNGNSWTAINNGMNNLTITSFFFQAEDGIRD